MGGHFNAEAMSAHTLSFVWLVDSFWHRFILSLIDIGGYYTPKGIKKAGKVNSLLVKHFIKVSYF